jgi:hypothetical protein
MDENEVVSSLVLLECYRNIDNLGYYLRDIKNKDYAGKLRHRISSLTNEQISLKLVLSKTYSISDCNSLIARICKSWDDLYKLANEFKRLYGISVKLPPKPKFKEIQ